MKNKEEIVKRLQSNIDFMLSCEKKCLAKVPGLYCNYCTLLFQQIELLEWVINKEGEFRAKLREVFKKAR